jgi:hypothetical protein
MTDLKRCHILLQILFPDQPAMQQSWWIRTNKRWKTTPEKMFDRDPRVVLKYLASKIAE